MNDLEGGILLVLWVIWAALLLGGALFGRLNAERTHAIPTWARMASSAILVGAAWASWLIAADTVFQKPALWIALGIICGFAGDLFMARLIIRSDTFVFGGIAAFGIGHALYIVGLLAFGNDYSYDNPGIRWGAVVIWLVLGAALWYGVVYRPAKARSALHLAALPYALLLAMTTAFGTGLALQTGDFIPLAIGAGLFLLSDLILAAQLFNRLYFPRIGDVIWLTYGPGQMLIVYTVPLALLWA